jgi:hypothetical protein
MAKARDFIAKKSGVPQPQTGSHPSVAEKPSSLKISSCKGVAMLEPRLACTATKARTIQNIIHALVSLGVQPRIQEAKRWLTLGNTSVIKK